MNKLRSVVATMDVPEMQPRQFESVMFRRGFENYQKQKQDIQEYKNQILELLLSMNQTQMQILVA